MFFSQIKSCNLSTVTGKDIGSGCQNHHWGAPDFENTVERLTPLVRANLVERIHQVNDTLVEEFANEVKLGKLDVSILCDRTKCVLDEFPIYNSAALFAGKINRLQFATFQRLWSAYKRRGEEEFTVTAVVDRKGVLNQEIYNLIKQTFVKTQVRVCYEWGDYVEKLVVSDSQPYQLSEAQCEQFRLELGKLPLSERNIVLMKDLEPNEITIDNNDFRYSYRGTVSQLINQREFFNLFCRAGGKRMIASTGILQAYLAVAGKNIQINPVLGLSSEKDIENGLGENVRDMGVAEVPGIVEMPEKADGFPAPGEDFSYHDFFHAYRQAEIPETHKRHFINLAQELISNKDSETSDNDKQIIQFLYESVIDGDYEVESLKSCLDLFGEGLSLDNFLFWAEIEEVLSRAFIRYKRSLPEISEEKILEKSFNDSKAIEIFCEILKNRLPELNKDGIMLTGITETLSRYGLLKKVTE
ncbi:MAG: hypothetical protein VX777_10570 [Chlamydiota bacterium]|nr:hypothetical protein [Chlamydiota bacterium]